MAIATEFDVDHKCEHSQEHDLSAKPAGDRNDPATWLSKQLCTNCWRKKSDKSDSAAFTAQRELEKTEALETAKKDSLPVLSGSKKQRDWGTLACHKLLKAAYVHKKCKCR